jgi:hypothetical protein
MYICLPAWFYYHMVLFVNSLKYVVMILSRRVKTHALEASQLKFGIKKFAILMILDLSHVVANINDH